MASNLATKWLLFTLIAVSSQSCGSHDSFERVRAKFEGNKGTFIELKDVLLKCPDCGFFKNSSPEFVSDSNEYIPKSQCKLIMTHLKNLNLASIHKLTTGKIVTIYFATASDDTKVRGVSYRTMPYESEPRSLKLSIPGWYLYEQTSNAK